MRSFDEYIDFDNSVPTSEEVDVSAVDWRETLRQECIDAVISENTVDNDDLDSE